MDIKEELEKLIKKFKSNEGYYKDSKGKYNETDTRNEFIDPFFELLGWDIHNKSNRQPALREVMRENYLTSTSRPDYAFTLSGVKKFFVEAKKPSVNITIDMDSILQARRYGYNANHLISVLTNFEYLIIYDATVEPKETDNPYTALITAPIHYTDYLTQYENIERLLSRETVYSGKFEENLEQQVNRGAHMQIDEHFLKQIREWRILLANQLYESHPEYTLEIISDLIQKFINQMVFLRICEDRNLPIYHNLQKTIEHPDDVQNEMLKMFKEADLKYNSGLFDGDNIIFDLNNKVIMDIVNTLYRPQSPYEFSVIEANLLGEIYENFLSEKLVLTTEGEITLTKKEENLHRDIVSTPQEIVRYMVDKALSPIVRGKKPEEILQLRIADIACGSGVFLIETYNYLVQYCSQWYQENDINHLIPGEDGIMYLPLEDKKDILVSCIYGIDIDPNAVEAAKFGLLLNLLENETIPTLEKYTKILPNIEENIQTGNALIDTELLGKRKLTREERLSIFPFDWEFSNNVNCFDVIIGNPPYMMTEDMKNLLPIKEFEIYKTNYKSSYKQFDKYFIFVERALGKLQTGGVLCYIIPPKFSKIPSGVQLREILTENSYVSEFIDFGSTQLFSHKDVLTYSSILLAKKEPQEEFTFEEVNDLQEWWANQEDTRKLKRVKYSSQSISNSPWILVTDENERLLLEKLYEDSVRLESITDVLNGIQTSAEDVYPFSKKEIVNETSTHYVINKKGTNYEIEKEIVRPYFKPTGKERGKGSYDFDIQNMYLIFPYDLTGKLYSEEEMKKSFSGTWKYFNDNYDRLLPKQLSSSKKGRDVRHATIDTWYQYGRHQHLTDFNNRDKLIVKVMKSETPMYWMDKNNMLIASGGTAGYVAISQKEDSPYSLEYIQAVLNHPAYQILSSIIGSDFEGGFNATGTSILYEMPIKKIDFSNSEQVELYNKIVESSQKIYSINEQLSKKLSIREMKNLTREKSQLISDIQNAVTELYGIEELMDSFSK
ncbi:Eco57I restriction-modification methylase domain-containing protein [Lysinibacillus endophyticus]|uniref:Eco57I restriction-modification methylase domain-containing protein n=1 Tax=Ureibacillus endophyticus TaxID=1978490 RepID=UPI003136A1E8